MCIVTRVKCWHCGKWFNKKKGQLDFQDCPHCGKGYEELTPEAKKAVERTLAPLKKMKVPEKLQTLETILDGAAQKTSKSLGLNKALGLVRSLQVMFPQPNYSLTRFRNPKKRDKSELQFWNYPKYKKQKALEKMPKLNRDVVPSRSQ